MRVLTAARFLIALGWRLDRKRLIRAVVLMFSGYVAAPFSALALADFVDDVLGHHPGPALVLAVLAAVLFVAQLMCGHFAHLDYFELAELQESGMRVELIDLVNNPPGIEHLDDPRVADDVDLVRTGLFASTRALEGVLQLTGLLLQSAITAGILIHLDPWLAFLPIFAIPPVVMGGRAQSVLETARERTAEKVRLSRHLLELATSVASAKELRLFGTEDEVIDRQEAAWGELTDKMWRAQAVSAGLRAVGQLVFALGYGGAILLVVHQASGGHASIGGLVLVITLAVQVSGQIAGALAQLSVLQTAGRTVERIKSLRAIAGVGTPAMGAGGELARRRVPRRLERGISLEGLTFAYPGGTEPALDGVTFEIPAGSTLALVGENGAGKSSLVKLLCGLYSPTAGRLLIDGVDLAEFDPAEWRARVATLFQDFFRLEFTLRESVGLGEVSLLDDDRTLQRALGDARAEAVQEVVPGGLAGYVGRGYADGVDLSGGQWQLLGLARCLMRELPLLLVLDEPAASLDAAAEHALFERYASTAKTTARELGGITVLVSHRFSTVLMADSIAVLRGGKLAEHGTHRELMENDALYAELFRLQARAYR
ncbi:MAG: ABC transporter ATP-binding protein [Acidimicrobiales bacterium]|jgi:ATP-binding cassette subfamily B protein